MRRPLPWFLAAVLTLALSATAHATTVCQAGVGSSGTYHAADINGCITALSGVAYAAGVQTDNIDIQVTSGGIIEAATQTVGGYTAGAFSTMVEPVPGQGFRDFLCAVSAGSCTKNNYLAYALTYNPTYGAFVFNPVVGGAAFATWTVTTNNVTIRYLQWSQATSGSTSPSIIATADAAASLTLDSNIAVTDSETHGAVVIQNATSAGTSVLTVTNNVFVGFSNYDNYMITANKAFLYYNTFAMPLSAYGAGACGTFDYQAGSNSVVSDNACIGFGLGTYTNGFQFHTNGLGDSGTNNAGSLATFMSSPFNTAAVVSCLPTGGSAAFVNAGATIWQWDFRIGTSSCLKGAATSAAGGITVDILGRTRNSPDDIGAWAYIAGTGPQLTAGVKVDVRLAGDALPDGTFGWSVPADFDCSHQTMLLIGTGGVGGNATGGAPGTGGTAGGAAGDVNCSKITLAPGNMPPLVVGAAGVLGSSQPGSSSFASTYTANGGTNGAGNGSGGPGGGTASGGLTNFSGGNNGGPNGSDDNTGGQGGGGAGGSNGAGGAGGNSDTGSSINAGSGSGAADGGSAGGIALTGAATNGAAGGNARGGTPVGGAGGTSGTPSGVSGTNGSGSGGAVAGAGNSVTAAAGSQETLYTATVGPHIGLAAGPGSGGGGGGGGFGAGAGGNGGAGANCGGGGGGGAAYGTFGVGGAGGYGCFIMVWGQASAPSTGNLLVGGWP